MLRFTLITALNSHTGWQVDGISNDTEGERLNEVRFGSESFMNTYAFTYK